MKKFFSALVAALLVAVTCLAAACQNPPPEFPNPGDNLGGGGVGDVADKSDETADEIVDAGNKDLTDVSGNTDSTNAILPQVEDGVAQITADGSYLISGDYSGVVIAKKVTAHLFLRNANVVSSSATALSTGKGCNVTITVEKGTQNVIATSGSNEENALHVKGNLTVNGGGQLTVTSVGKHAVKVSQALTVTDATLIANGASHAVACASLTASGATVTVTAGKDGINADCDFDNSDGKTDYAFTTDEGFVSMTNCNYTANVQGDGIQAETFVYLSESNLNVTCTATFVSYSSANMAAYDLDSDDFRYVKRGSSYYKTASDDRLSSSNYAMTQSCKGIKVGQIDYEVEFEDGSSKEVTVANGNYAFVVEGGNVVINSDDDAIHVNGGNAFVNSGTLTLTTLDDGITADKLTRISGGVINIPSCYEGLEGAQVEILGGQIDIVSQDDAVNAASDDTSLDKHIIVSGGKVTVSAEGDGFDSNGSMLFSGGEVVIYGPTSGGNAGLDADRGIVVTGGSLFATSTLGMVETPSTNSTQNVLSFAQNSTIAAGTVITLTDSDGNVLMSVTLSKACQSIILSCGQLTTGNSYSVYGGDVKLADFTVNSVITSIGSSTRPGGGGFGGGGHGRP